MSVCRAAFPLFGVQGRHSGLRCQTRAHARPPFFLLAVISGRRGRNSSCSFAPSDPMDDLSRKKYRSYIQYLSWNQCALLPLPYSYSVRCSEFFDQPNRAARPARHLVSPTVDAATCLSALSRGTVEAATAKRADWWDNSASPKGPDAKTRTGQAGLVWARRQLFGANLSRPLDCGAGRQRMGAAYGGTVWR